MPLQSRPTTQGNGRCILSLDAGGTRGISQLSILIELMHRLNYDAGQVEPIRPCDVFDMIGGSGSGGFTSILLVAFGLTADQALEEFIELSVNILDLQGVDASTRTAALEKRINGLLDKYEIRKDMRLLDSSDQSGGCRLVAPISYKQNVGTSCILRNFSVRREQTADLTVASALLSTLAMPSLFTSSSVFRESVDFEYIGADMPLSNPARQLLSEAHEAFGPDERVSCLVSIACGHTGIMAAPKDSDIIKLETLLERIVTDSDREAQGIDSQMGHLGIYHRFSVTKGLELPSPDTPHLPRDIITHTAAYLADVSISRRLDACVDSLNLRDGIISLEQLIHSSGQSVLLTPLPPLTKTFVMRKKPWAFIEKAMFGSEGSEGPKMLAITGIGGCGKTQLIMKFMRVHRSQFISVLFVDGSSAPRIRADIIRYVRSSGPAHSQKTFEECLLFLAQPTHGSPCLLVYDNVDDPELDLLPLLPPGDTCNVIITSRNRSVGELCPEAHLQLDKMEMDEAIELLLYRTPGDDAATTQARDGARRIADALGCLPIALQQARSYMYHARCSTNAYLERLNTSRDRILAQPVRYQQGMRYLSTYAAFAASFEQLPPRGQKLLYLLSLCHWSKFPVELVILAAKYKFSEYEYRCIDDGDELNIGRALLEEIFLVDGEWDAVNLDELLVSLQSYSLVTLVEGVDTALLEIHPLLHGWVRSSLPEQDLSRYRSAAVLIIALGDRKNSTPSAQYLGSHIKHLSPLWPQLRLNDATAFGRIMYASGLTKEALVLQERVCSDTQALGNRWNPNLLDPRWALALSYLAAGRFEEAESLQISVLKATKGVLGERHPDAIIASGNLANIYYDLGRLTEAQTLQEKVLRLSKEVLGEHHPETIGSSSNLARTYSHLGRHRDAQTLQEEALRLTKERQGERHLDAILASSNLAITYLHLGRLEEAEGLQEEVLKLSREILGESHPDTISATHNRAIGYAFRSKWTQSIQLLDMMGVMYSDVLGEGRPLYRKHQQVRSWVRDFQELKTRATNQPHIN